LGKISLSSIKHPAISSGAQYYDSRKKNLLDIAHPFTLAILLKVFRVALLRPFSLVMITI
jgi:hypothetical protein